MQLVGDTEVDEDDTVADLGIADGSMLELSNEDEFVDEEDDFGVSVEVLNSEVMPARTLDLCAADTFSSCAAAAATVMVWLCSRWWCYN